MIQKRYKHQQELNILSSRWLGDSWVLWVTSSVPDHKYPFRKSRTFLLWYLHLAFKYLLECVTFIEKIISCKEQWISSQNSWLVYGIWMTDLCWGTDQLILPINRATFLLRTRIVDQQYFAEQKSENKTFWMLRFQIQRTNVVFIADRWVATAGVTNCLLT